MNSRRAILWWVFWLGVGAVISALAWASLSVSGLERRNDANRALAQRTEQIRLALWRVDSQLAPIIAMEAARPAGEWVSTLYQRKQTGGPWQDLSDALPYPTGNVYTVGQFAVDERNAVVASDARTKSVADKYADQLTSQRDEPLTEPASRESEESARGYDYEARQKVANFAQQAPLKDEASAAREARSDTPETLTSLQAAPASSSVLTRNLSAEALSSALTGPVEARWIESDAGVELVLVRSVPTDSGPRTEGVRLDWPVLRSTLEGSVADLLPGASLVPANGSAAAQMERRGDAYRLATIPALLVPPLDGGLGLPGRMTPTLWALVVTWVAALAALSAVGLVLRATLRLSDRRARFVGAVTHELRTPLTTFRLYAQMLAGGMVTDEKAKSEYLGTLERESVRLGEIVENVLEYARLTRRRPGGARPPGERSISPSELLARVRPVLSRRAEQSGMDLIVSVDPSAEAPRTVTCDPRSVERILMNLVENACKYALGPGDENDDADTRIHLDLGATDRVLEVLVADHGRGIPRRERERVFGEFQRGPEAADGSKPGLGLGLALSRGLAREMGGDLRLVRRRGHGAEFLLTVPLDPPESPAGSP